VLHDLLDAEPPVRFEIVTTHSRAGVRLVVAGEVDLAIVTGLDTPRALEDRHLFDQPFFWVGPRRGRREPLTERLRREPVLRLAAESRGRTASTSTSTGSTRSISVMPRASRAQAFCTARWSSPARATRRTSTMGQSEGASGSSRLGTASLLS